MRSILDALPGAATKVHGRVVCDYLRLMWKKPTVDLKFAPGHLDDKPDDWLVTIARALEKNDSKPLADRIHARLVQFRD